MKQIKSSEDILSFIRRISFFQAFSLEEKRQVADQHGKLFVVAAGEKIINEGDMEDSFYIILAGSVSVVRRGVALSTLNAGECFGEMAFLTGEARSTDVTAQDSQTIVLRVDHSLLEKLNAEAREKIKDRLLAKLVERLNVMNQLIY